MQSEGSLDEVLVDFLTCLLLALQPARHPTPARPRLFGLGIAVLYFHGDRLAIQPGRAVAYTVLPTTPLGSPIAEGRKLLLEFRPFGRPRLLVLLLYLRQRITLLVERKITEPLDDGTQCKLSSHVQSLSMLGNPEMLAVTRRLTK